MQDWIHINNILWSITELRISTKYKLFLWDFNSKREFNDEVNEIIEKKHEETIEENKLNIAKKWKI